MEARSTIAIVERSATAAHVLKSSRRYRELIHFLLLKLEIESLAPDYFQPSRSIRFLASARSEVQLVKVEPVRAYSLLD